MAKQPLPIIAFLLLLFFVACNQEETTPTAFRLLKKEQTGLDFKNVPRQDKTFNVFSYMYFFNGGGVAVGDFNKDGLEDIFLTSNMDSNKLFLNEGKLKFRDITDKAGMEGLEGWTTGASVVDINNDGLLDIYVSQMGDYLSIKGKNQLYVCQEIINGIPRFEDKAAEYSLDLVGFSTQASFFDYDLDGDLDMFQLNHSLHQNGTFGQRKSFEGTQHPYSGDKLMRNDNGKFTDVTLAAGINSTVIGYGLGIATGDINLDGYPDIYIGNDFHENDYLYLNQQNGTFKEVLKEQILHTSRFSMGVDIADINNDGWDEIISLDMLPDDPYILKSSLGEDEYGPYKFKLGYGYNHQFARNNLQLNNGDGTFTEIGMYAGIHATDWSWASLFLDFDNDGLKDVFISNGIPRRMNDIDYINYRTGDEDLKWKTLNNYLKEEELSIVEKMPQIKLPNRFFKNNGDLTFKDINDQVDASATSYSNGAAYADFDNDGDLDLIVNNISDEPFLYENLNATLSDTKQDFLSIRFKGTPKNINAIGARVVVFKKKERIIYEHFPVRGYQSSVQLGLHIGIGDEASVEKVLVIFPDRTYMELANPSFNQVSTVIWKEGLPLFDFTILQHPQKENPYQFADAGESIVLPFTHKENPFIEFDRERLIPQMVSSEGPASAVGDVNGDGLEDIFFGSAKRVKSCLLLQTKKGTFVNETPASIEKDSIFEDVDAVLVDIENDGDLDLVIAAGGNEYTGTSEALKQRTYINDGKGGFERKDIFPNIYMTASCILPTDFNQDGLVDFFLGGRSIPWNYGKTPDSYLFKNMGNGNFEEVTEKYSSALKKVGMVKDGAWADIDQDGDQDLILAVEWEAIQIFLNEGNSFKQQPLNDLKGWWNFVLPYDFDQDGDIDLLAGNLGKNSKFQAANKAPIKLYIEDFDNNKQIEQILTYQIGGREIPYATYKELTQQLVSLKKKYLYAKDLAKASMNEIFGKEKLESAKVLEANYFESAYFENTGNGNAFKVHSLPNELQFSTLEAASLGDFDNNGIKEVLLGGNFYECNIEMGRYDGNYGNVLAVAKDGALSAFPLGGLKLSGQVRRIEPIHINKQTYFIIAKNNDPAQLIYYLPNRGI